MLRKFKDIPLQRKLILLYILFVGIPMLLLIGIFAPVSQYMIVDREYQNRLRLLSIMAESVEFKMGSIENDIYGIYNHKELFNPKATNSSLRRDIFDFFTGQVYFNNFHYIPLKGPTITFSRYSDVFNPDDVFRSIDPDWLKAMDEANGKVVWFPPLKLDSEDKIDYFICGNVIKNIYGDHQKVGYSMFLINSKTISGIFDTLKFSEYDSVSVYDKDHKPIWFSSGIDAVGKISGGEGYYISKDTDGKKVLGVYKQSSYNDWIFQCTAPLAEINYYGTLFLIFLGVSLLFFIVSLLLETRVISNLFVRPIQKLVVGLDSMDERMIFNYELPYSHDEIGVLYRSIKNMSHRIQTLLKDNEEAHKNELTQELNALQAQINPHFIYNTLDSICWIARANNVPQINDMLIDLSNILRYSISDGKRYATFQQEIQWACAYVSLQQKRAPGQFALEIDVDESIYPYYTFRLVLQPFIENTILHGFKHVTKDGYIKITGRLVEGDIQLSIEDNGSGIAEDRLETLNSNVERGIGIYNVHRRIRLFFGEKYGVNIVSDRGTKVYITLPAVTDFRQFE